MVMLPNESLAEVTAFLKLFDLSGPLLASRRFTALAADASLHIPVFDFSVMILSESGAHTRYDLYARHSETGSDEEIHENIEFSPELLPIALRNCVVDFLILLCEDHGPCCVARAVRKEADFFAVTKLILFAKCFADTEDLLSFLAPFRKLEAVRIVDDEGQFRRKQLSDDLRQTDLDMEYIGQNRTAMWRKRFRRFTNFFVKRMRQVLP